MSLSRCERSHLARQIPRYMARRGPVDVFWVPAERRVRLRSLEAAYAPRVLPPEAVHVGRYEPAHPVADILDDLDFVVGDGLTPVVERRGA